MTFRVGQKVVCICDGSIPGEPRSYGCWEPGAEIHVGEIYTIHSTLSHMGTPMVRLYERKRCEEILTIWGIDGYCADRFRPVVERKSDISIFTSLLHPSPQKVLEEVMSDTLAEIYLSAREASVTFTHPSDPPR